MFDTLAGRLEGVFKSLRGRGKLTEGNIREAMRDVRRALLEADVHYEVARDLVTRVEKRAVGQAVLRSITPGQQVVKIVHEELIQLLDASGPPPAASAPAVVMLVGLQGAGKTTLAAKLARVTQQRGKRPLLVAADTVRPAAVEQLVTHGRALGIEVARPEGDQDALAVARRAVRRRAEFDQLVIDTAGRLHVDAALMDELGRVQQEVAPAAVLLVVDAMTGQDAVRTAQEFDGQLGVDGVALTKLDGDARGGAALSIRAVTGKPIWWASVGERLEAIESFDAERMASRLLGMGDVVSLVERAGQAIDVEEAAKLERKLRRREFTLSDFQQQIEQMQKMGPLSELLKMMPGMGAKLAGVEVPEGALGRVRAIICSMTPGERERPKVIGATRKRRIARGAGVSVHEVNKLLKQFEQVRKMMKSFRGGRMPAF